MVRTRGTRALPPVLGVAAASLAPAVARAETEAIRIEYRADALCPSQAEFTAKVLRRTQRARLASAHEPARTFVVAITRHRAGFRGSLVIREADRSTIGRRVEGANCGELADALALSTALAVDPTAPSVEPATSTPADALGTGPGSADTTTRSPNTPGGRPSDSGEARARPSEGPRDGRTAPEPRDDDNDERGLLDEPEPERSDAPSLGTRSWSHRVFLGPELRSGGAPRVALGASLAVQALRLEPEPWFSGVGIELVALRSLTGTTDDASSQFQYLLGRPELCGLIAQRPSFELLPCVQAELGLIEARGSDLPNPRTERRFWAAVVAPLRAELAVGERALLGASVGLVIPITRYHFVFTDPETSVYRVPRAAFTAGLRFGVRL